MDLNKKIRTMAEYMEIEDIAETLGIPSEQVESVLGVTSRGAGSRSPAAAGPREPSVTVGSSGGGPPKRGFFRLWPFGRRKPPGAPEPAHAAAGQEFQEREPPLEGAAVDYQTWLASVQRGVVPAAGMRAPGEVRLDVPVLANVVGFYSGTKGGTGKTTLAANFAAYLQASGSEVVVVDLDVNTRGLTMLSFGEDPARWPQRLSRSGLLGGVYVHPPVGVSGLAPLSQSRDWVLLDFGSIFTEETVEVLAICGAVVLVTLPEHLSVAVVRRFMFREKQHVRGDVILAVNRAKPRSPLTPWEAAKRIGLDLGFIIPDDVKSIEDALKWGTVPALVKGSRIRKSVEEASRKVFARERIVRDEKGWN